jgi:hypothetical protein
MKPPPDVSEKDFSSAIKEFRQAVGGEWVFVSPEDVDLYRDAYSPYRGEDEERFASAAVAPCTVEEVQKVVATANRYRIPIYPISTGKNLGYGGSAPVFSGSVVLDLKRMDRILEVNERNAYAVVEPGVSYFDMYRYLHDNGIKLWIDVPDPGWGSLVGNALDFGGGYTSPWYRAHFEAHCGMEIVLANSEILRTGMGAMPGAQTWQQYKFGFGPYLDGLFKQSNFGVVTKMGFWLFPEPEAHMFGQVTVPRHDDLIPLIDIMNHLENSNIFNGLPGIGNPLLGGFGFGPSDTEASTLLSNYGLSSPELESYAKRTGKPYWSCSLHFYGPPDVIQAQWQYAKSRFGSIPGAEFQDGEIVEMPLSPDEIARVHKPRFGIPSLEMFSLGARSKTNSTPSSGHFWFSPIIPRTGEAVLEANQIIRKAAKEMELPILFFSPPVAVWIRAFILVLAMPITADVETNRKNRASIKKLIKICADHGWGEYRTATAYYDAVMDTYSYNDHIHRRVCEAIKDAIDPNGILSAGRYGIWPRNLREGMESKY